ncbi:DUF4442 domain-containing protein [Limnobacter humi]|uniref:DUF4442 domain-containing protein n=1 Tax=Limnobacter humi TaxID=1778671 RepID=A0ABT1WDY3_9BURK|nr:DUF4442 domain-containing protein [Limnobacter humi]MCQ8895737.1 DUF4442 domain-containing protein [Limnobacter humi]
MEGLMNKLMRPVVKMQMDGKVPFAKACGVRLEHMDYGQARSAMEPKAELQDDTGHVHPGALFTLAETCSGGAMAGGFASIILKVRPVAAQVEFQLKAPAQGRCTAHSRVEGNIGELKRLLDAEGKINFPVQVEVKDARGTEVASMTVLWNLKRT